MRLYWIENAYNAVHGTVILNNYQLKAKDIADPWGKKNLFLLVQKNTV
jgi:hypothetical protein